jgi:hypothetical protein
MPRGVVFALLAVATAGCASQGGVRDGGAAPTLSAPTSAEPLWPGFTPPTVPPAGEQRGFKRYLPLDKVRAPVRGVAALSAKTLLEHDPNVPEVVQRMIAGCPAGDCPLRAAVPRDVTGDGRSELVVAVDLPKLESTLVQVYGAVGRTIRPVLIYWGPLGLTGETFGRDLLISVTGKDGRFTIRFRWNGDVMAAVTPESAADTPREPADGVITPRPIPSTDTRTTP